MNTGISFSDRGIIVTVEEGKNEAPCKTKGISQTTVLKAKLENTEIEVGRARLCMPNQKEGSGSQGFFFFEEISTNAPNMEMVKLVLMEAARELLPRHDIVADHNGEIPKEVGKVEKFSEGLYILKPIAVFA